MLKAVNRPLAVLAFAGIAFAASVHGEEIHRQDPLNSFGGPASQDARNPGGLGLMYVTADNFPGQAGQTVTSVELWGGYASVEPGNLHGFMVRFYEDAAGQIGPMISTQDATVFTATQYYIFPTLNYPGYHYTFDLPQPFAIPATGQYWVALVAISDFGGGSTGSQWGWVQSTGFNAPDAVQSIFGGPFNPIQGDMSFVLHDNSGPGGCYANCDQSTAAPILNVADFTCFLQRFAAGESYANCDNSTAAPTLNVADFTCFLQAFAAGCP